MEASPFVTGVVASQLCSAAVLFPPDMKWCFFPAQYFWHRVEVQAKKPECKVHFILNLAICV